MNISMYRTAKSLEIVEVEVYGCFILCPLSLFAQNFDNGRFFIYKILDFQYNNMFFPKIRKN